MTIKLLTERLELRPLAETDIRPFATIVGNRKITDAAGFYHTRSTIEARNILRQMMTSQVLGIVLRKTGELIGCVGLYERMQDSGEPDANGRELGYMLSESAWSNGYMTEATAAIIRFAFEELRLERLYASCFEENLASMRILEKNGFQFVGQMTHSPIALFQPGQTEFFFELAFSDWQKKAKNIKMRLQS